MLKHLKKNIYYICLHLQYYPEYALFLNFKLTVPQQQQQSKATSKQKGRQQRHQDERRTFFVVGLSSWGECKREIAGWRFFFYEDHNVMRKSSNSSDLFSNDEHTAPDNAHIVKKKSNHLNEWHDMR